MTNYIFVLFSNAYNELLEKYKEEALREEIPTAELKEEYSKENLIKKEKKS
ncbi:MAG: hypothetical protein ACTSV5_03580 [Promethearchaeota archaeon]